VFLFLGVSGLLFVIDGWADDFGGRSAVQFGDFVGPLPLGLPLLAVLLATHVNPVLPHARAIVITALVEYGVSALFGAITFLGAFAYDLASVRDTLEGLLWRVVWLGLFIFAGIVVTRVLIGTFPSAPPRRYATYGAPVYGRPYPGQPLYPQPTYQRGAADPTAIGGHPASVEPDRAAATAYPPSPSYAVPTTYTSGYPDEPGDDLLFDLPTSETGWPVVPPPPMPTPPSSIPVPPQAAQVHTPTQQATTPDAAVPPMADFDPTVRVTPVTPLNGDATQLLPPRAGTVGSAGTPSDDDIPGGGEPPTKDQ
jgi:hypothetical protein